MPETTTQRRNTQSAGGFGGGRGRGSQGDRGGHRRRQEPSDGFESQLLDLARVARVAAGGRRFRFRATVVVGNMKGQVGIGVAKGLDVAASIEKATRRAKKSLITVKTKNDTIAHEVSAKFGASKVLLRPQMQGRGLVAGGVVRVICEKAGIKNISSKFISRSGNKLNNAMATLMALSQLKQLPTKDEEKKEAKKE